MKISVQNFRFIGYIIKIGVKFFANHNLEISNLCKVKFRKNVYIWTYAGIYISGYPFNIEVRNSRLEYEKKITIENNVWIIGNVSILQRVTIGDNVTIGVRAVVTKNIPFNANVFGNLCKVFKVNEKNDGNK